MDTNPDYWQSYYSGTDAELQILRTYSARIRYYWTDPKIDAALTQMIDALTTTVPETLISQAFMGFDFGDMPSDPDALIDRHVQRCVGRYFDAAGFRAG